MKNASSTLPPAAEGRAERFAMAAQVRVQKSDTDYVLDVVNVSLSGALIDLAKLRRPKWLKVRRTVEVTLLADDSLLELRGVVVRIVEDLDGARFAIRFESGQSLDALGELLRSHGQPLPPPLPGSPR